jgi:uncharacterized protein (TIGR02231 family)
MMFSGKSSRVVFLVLFLLIAGLFLLPRTSPAKVREVTLFPQSAKIDETVTAVNKTTVLVLPPEADPESLVLSLPAADKIRVEDIQIKPVKRVDENKIAQLRAQIKKLQNDKKELQARVHALEAQIQFWQAQTKSKTKSVAETDQLAAAIGKNIRRLYSEKNTIESDYSKLDKQIKELEEALHQAAGKKETTWEVNITLSNAKRGDVALNYSYMVKGCGWKPLYRLEAVLSSKTVLFSWDAEIWQSTGADWKGVPIHLATAQPPKTLAPPELPPWIIKPKTPHLYKSSRRAKSPAEGALKAAEMDNATAEIIPIETAHATYSVWSVGETTLEAGSRRRIKIREEKWPASFSFLSRPNLSPQAFVQAQITLPQPIDIPPGQALFVIDGALQGKREFVMAGAEAGIYFGNSPFVTVTTSMIEDKTGALKFLQNKQTRQWHWKLEAKNEGRSPVTLRIEEPVPQGRDERIKLSFKHRPEPSEKDASKWTWILDLPALQKISIETTVEMEAPGDMELDFGIRR